MDLQFYGANCITFTYKGVRVVVDDNLADLGGRSIIRDDDIALFTGAHGTPAAKLKLLADSPGEYEVADFSIVGVAARANMDEPSGKKTATMYKITAGEIDVLVTGPIYPDVNNTQLEATGPVDVLIVPVGGMGYSTDAVGALKLIKEFEPKLIIPTHYADKKTAYPVPQTDLAQALKELAMEPKETVAKLKLKPTDLGDSAQLIVLDRS